MPMQMSVNFPTFLIFCLQILALALLFGQTSEFVHVANCSDGTQAVFPCDQTSKQCTGNPELGCELHGPIYFCCGTSNSSTHKPTTTTRVFPISDDNCTDKFPQCEHWAKRGICFLGMYNDMTKAKLCPKSCRVCHLAGLAAQQKQPAAVHQQSAVGYSDHDGFNTRRLGNDDSDDMDNGGLLHGKLLPMEKSTSSTMGSSPSMASSTIPSSTSPSTTVSTEASASTIDDFGYNGNQSKTGSDIASSSISTQETAAIPLMTTSSSEILIISSTSSTNSSSMPTTSSSSSTSSSSMPTTSSSSSTSSSSMPTTSSSATTKKLPTIVKKRVLSPEEGELIHEERELEREKTRKKGFYNKKTIDGNKKEVERNLDEGVENGEEKKALSVKKKKKEQRKAKKANKEDSEVKNKANKIFGKNVKNMMGQEQENIPENYGNEGNNRYADGKEWADYDYAADYDGAEDVDDVDDYDVDGYDDGEVNEEADDDAEANDDDYNDEFIDEPRGDRFFHSYLDVYKRKQDDFWTQWKAGMRGLQHRLEEEESNRRLPKKSRLKKIVIKERTKS